MTRLQLEHVGEQLLRSPRRSRRRRRSGRPSSRSAGRRSGRPGCVVQHHDDRPAGLGLQTGAPAFQDVDLRARSSYVR
ncbi:hypothetical protein HBB16_21580 [Pseudonocardia sp. MCCB 268]|nr:hypothetical protein [Pseudonocardia cytotoxica]